MTFVPTDRPTTSDALAAPPDPADRAWRHRLAELLAASPQPVARRLSALLLAVPADPSTREALAPFQRRLDITHRVHAACAPDDRRPLGDELLAGPGCVGLITLCLLQADAAAPQAGPGWRLAWLNTAFRALDALRIQDAGLAAGWHPLVDRLLAAAIAVDGP